LPVLADRRTRLDGSFVRPTDPIAEALPAALEPRVDQLRKRIRKARRGDADAIHDARTTLRRLREGIVVMGRTAFDPAATRALERELHEVERALGPTRDDDVLLADVHEWLRHAGRDARQALTPLVDRITSQRKKHLRTLVRDLGRGRSRRALQRARRLFRDPSRSACPPPKNPARAMPSLVRHFVPDTTWRAYEEVLAYEVRLPADLEVIHKVRSSCRRLRYLLELLEGAIPPGAEDVVGSLRALQDRLGDLHDHAVAVNRIAAWCTRGKLALEPALTEYLRRRVDARERLRAEFEGEWAALTGDAFRTAIAHLASGEMGTEPVPPSQDA
jgi:CHAD domain-containing protein